MGRQAFRTPAQASSRQPAYDWIANTQDRIDDQAQLVATLKPGSKAHRTAVELLFLLQDSLHLFSETGDLLCKLRDEEKID